MNEIVNVLKQSELCGQQFNVYGTPDEPLFKAKDVANLLQLTNVTDMISRVDSEELTKFNLGSQAGETWFLTEDGLYEVLMQSRKPIAKQFKKGVKTILKEIRKHGGYIAERQDETPEDLMARALQVANETLKRKEARLKQLEDTNKEQEQQLAAAAPKVEYVDKVLQSVNTYTVQQIAKELDTTANKLYAFLSEKKVLFKQSGTWLLNSRYNGKGYAKTRTYQYTRNDGTSGTKTYTVITEAGRAFIHKIYNN